MFHPQLTRNPRGIRTRVKLNDTIYFFWDLSIILKTKGGGRGHILEAGYVYVFKERNA